MAQSRAVRWAASSAAMSAASTDGSKVAWRAVRLAVWLVHKTAVKMAATKDAHLAALRVAWTGN
jgi:hypothetical protein